MTPSTPSILPAPVDAGRSTDAASFSRAPRQGATERSFEEFCSDARCDGQKKPHSEVQQGVDTATQPVGEPEPAEDESSPAPAVSEQPSRKEETLPRAATAEAIGVVAPQILPETAVITQTAVAVGQPANLATPVSTQAAPVPTAPGATTAKLAAETTAPTVTDPKTAAQKQVASTVPVSKEQEAVVDADQPRHGKLGRFSGRQGNPSVEGEEGKGFRANFAARHGISEESQEVKGAKDFLTIGKQLLTKLRSIGGTDTAIPADSMNLAPKFSGQLSGLRHSHTPGVADLSGGAGTEFAWKGWTNSGGEHASAVARFSHMAGAFPGVAATLGGSEGTSTAGTNAAAPGSTVSNPWSSMEPKAALAPVGAAIERLIVRGQEQLSVTIRFEQGGTLSLKLGMTNGEIAARIHTDVAGLDKALRSGWGEFAQDWNGRGIKLAAPVITSHTQGFAQHEHNSAGQREGNPRGHDFAEPREERGSFERGFRSRRFSNGQGVTADRKAEHISTNTSPMDRIRSGLKTWA